MDKEARIEHIVEVAASFPGVCRAYEKNGDVIVGFGSLGFYRLAVYEDDVDIVGKIARRTGGTRKELKAHLEDHGIAVDRLLNS